MVQGLGVSGFRVLEFKGFGFAGSSSFWGSTTPRTITKPSRSKVARVSVSMASGVGFRV